MSASQQVRKTSSSPFSRDVFMTNQKLKSLQQHTEQILKKNKQKNKSLQSNLHTLKGQNGTSSNEEVPSASLLTAQSQSAIKAPSSSVTTSPKVSPREVVSAHQLSNPSQAKMNGSRQHINSNSNIPKSLSSIPSSSISTHNLSKQAQSTLKQLQQTLHNSNNPSNNKKNHTPPKYTQDSTIQNNRISALANSNKSVSSDDTPKFKPQKNGEQQGVDLFQFSTFHHMSNITGVEEYHPPNSSNVLSSVFSFGHESEEEERIKRGEPPKPSHFSQLCIPQEKQKEEKKKRVSFCSPTIHTYSTDEDKRFDNYFTEKIPSKSNLSAQSLTQIPSCLSQKASILVNNQRSSSPLPQTQITQPVSIIKKHDTNAQQQQQRTSFNSSLDGVQISSCTSSISQNINSNNQNKSPNNELSNVVANTNANSQVDQLNNHVIFESFAPKQPHQILINGIQQQPFKPNQIAPFPNQTNTRYNNSISNNNNNNTNGQVNQPNSVSFIIQNAIKNLNNMGIAQQEEPKKRSISPVAPVQQKVEENYGENKTDKFEEARKNLVKKDQDISQIISSSPIKKTTSHEYILCKELMNGQMDQFGSRSDIVMNAQRVNNFATLQQTHNYNILTQQGQSNLPNQVNSFVLPLQSDIFNIKIDNAKDIAAGGGASNNSNNITSNLIQQKNNQSDTTITSASNTNSDTFLINKNFSTSTYTTSPQSSIPQSSSTLLNQNNLNINNIPTITITNTYQQPIHLKDNFPSATSSFASQSTPPFRSSDQTTLAGSSNFANTDIKLSVIQPVATSSFALGSHITLSPQESIASIQSSQNYNNNNPNSTNINPLNSYYSTSINNSNLNGNNFNSSYNQPYGNVIYLSNQKGITMPTSLSNSSDAYTNSNTTANTNNSCTINLDVYKVSVPSFDASDKGQNRQDNNSFVLQNIQNGNQNPTNNLNINSIKINLESIQNSSLYNNSNKEDQKDSGNTGNNSTCNTNTNSNTNYLNGNMSSNNNCISNSPFSTQSNQNTTMTTTTTFNNRQSFETTFWRNETDLTPSEYFLSFITNNPKPCPKPCFGGGALTPQANPVRKNSSNNNTTKDSFISQSHFVPLTKQSIEMGLDNSLDLYQNNFSVSSSIINPSNHLNNTSNNNFSSYGLQQQQKKQSKSPQRIASSATPSLKSSYCSTSGLAKRQQTVPNQQIPVNQQKNKSFSNYISSSSNNISHTQNNLYQQQYPQSSLSPSKRLNQSNNNPESSNSQKRPIFLEYNSVSTIKKPSNNSEVSRKANSQLNSRKTSQQSAVKKDVSSLYNISKITSQNHLYNNNHGSTNYKKANQNINQPKDVYQQNYYQLEKDSQFAKTFNSEQCIQN